MTMCLRDHTIESDYNTTKIVTIFVVYYYITIWLFGRLFYHYLNLFAFKVFYITPSAVCAKTCVTRASTLIILYFAKRRYIYEREKETGEKHYNYECYLGIPRRNGIRKELPIMHHLYSAIRTSAGMREISLQAQHLSHGYIFLTGEITSGTAEDILAELLYLKQNNVAPVLILNSPGGSVSDGLVICDTLRNFPGEITTVCAGLCASMAAHILACGTKGRRFILPHSRTMIHQALVSQCPGGNAGSMQQLSKNLNETNEILVQLLSETTGRSVAEINTKIEHGDFNMCAEETVNFGLCDSIIDSIFTL